jgi:hypothetical protein
MVPLFMIVTEIAFLRHCRIKPEHRKRNSQPHSEAHGGVLLKQPRSQANERLAVGSVPQGIRLETVAASTAFQNWEAMQNVGR